MIPTDASADRAHRLLKILEPHLLRLLADAPPFGEVTIGASLRDGDISRVRLGAEISRMIPPRAER